MPRLPLWGVAERSESFKIMIAGGNHSTIKSWQPEGLMYPVEWYAPQVSL